MSLWAIIPVKPLKQSKTRLSGVLSAEERGDLTRRLFVNMLTVLNQIPEIERCLVVSPDKQIGELAQEHGAQIFSDEKPIDLNVAVTSAAKLAYENGATGIAVLPVDLPMFDLLAAQDLFSVPDPVLICPDEKYDGTNALVLRGVTDFKFAYGEDSFARHLKECTRHSHVAQMVFVDAIQFDLDTPADWQRYQKHLGVNV